VGTVRFAEDSKWLADWLGFGRSGRPPGLFLLSPPATGYTQLNFYSFEQAQLKRKKKKTQVF
jgi:hypothetical protein